MRREKKRKEETSAKGLDPALLFIAFGAIARLIPHPANFTPIAAMALFGGVHLDRRRALLVPVAALAISDAFLSAKGGFSPFSWIILSVYASFMTISLIGMGLRRARGRQRIAWLAAATLGSSLLFFVVTNFAVWAMGGLYPLTAEGIVQCYVAAIPFWRNTILGDAFWVTTTFGGYALLQRYVLKPRRTSDQRPAG